MTAMIRGLDSMRDFITPREEIMLIKLLDKETWEASAARRTQEYGLCCNISIRDCNIPNALTPPWCNILAERLVKRGLLRERPNLVSVEEFLPSQGYFPHVDDTTTIADGVVTLVLCSDMHLKLISAVDDSIQLSMPLERRSATSFCREAHHDWRRCVPQRKPDGKRRLVITFRRVVASAKGFKQLN